MTGVLVLGALHHDVVVDAPRLPRADETLRGSAVDYRFGGKGGNQALAAARMGANVRMAGRVGADAAGDSLIATLDGSGIDRQAVAIGTMPTGMSVAITLPDGNYGAVIVSGANLENDGQVAQSDGPEVVLIQNEIPAGANRALASSLKNEDVLIWNAAPALPMDDDLAARTEVLVVNRIEAKDLTGIADPELCARNLCGRIRGIVVVTLGGDGVVIATGDGVTRKLARAIEPVSAHGAGDLFVGALGARLAQGDALNEAVDFAQTAAALFVASKIAARHEVTCDRVEAVMSAKN